MIKYFSINILLQNSPMVLQSQMATFSSIIPFHSSIYRKLSGIKEKSSIQSNKVHSHSATITEKRLSTVLLKTKTFYFVVHWELKKVCRKSLMTSYHLTLQPWFFLTLQNPLSSSSMLFYHIECIHRKRKIETIEKSIFLSPFL